MQRKRGRGWPLQASSKLNCAIVVGSRFSWLSSIDLRRFWARFTLNFPQRLPQEQVLRHPCWSLEGREGAILDQRKVTVKHLGLQRSGVPGIRHYEAIRREIIRLVREERERRKLSNYAVAQRSGVSESMLSLVERGLRNPTMELMLRMADGVGADLPALIKKAIAATPKEQSGAVSKVKRRGASSDS